MRKHFASIGRRFALLGLLGIPWQVVAQRFNDVEPQWLRGRLTDAGVGLYFEDTREERSYQAGVSETYERTFEGISQSLTLDGSIYHPNFMRFDFNSDGAFGWTQEKIKTSSGDTLNRGAYDFLGNISGNLILL